MSLHIDSDGIELRSYLAVPADGMGTNGLVLCHGFPQAPREAASAGLRYAELADRIADQVGMTVLTFNFRGTGQSEGDFSLGGWKDDLKVAIQYLREEAGAQNVWLSGFGAGGSLALVAAAEDSEIRGVSVFSVRADFDDWADNWELLLAHARNYGMIKTESFPSDQKAWTQELRDIRPLDVMHKLAGRDVMLVHGSDDDRVPVSDARKLAELGGSSVDLRIIYGAGHRLRHDPRIVALLLGWLDRRH